MKIVKFVEAQRPTVRETTLAEVQFDRVDRDLQLHQVAQARPAWKAQTPDASGAVGNGSGMCYTANAVEGDIIVARQDCAR